MQQGRIHGHQLRTGGQGRICAFSHFSTRAYGRTNGPTDQRTVGRDSDSRQLLLFWGVVNYHNTLSVFMKRHRTSSPNGENQPTLQ